MQLYICPLGGVLKQYIRRQQVCIGSGSTQFLTMLTVQEWSCWLWLLDY